MILRAKLVDCLEQSETANANDMLETLRWVDHTDKDAQGLFPPCISCALTMLVGSGGKDRKSTHAAWIMERGSLSSNIT